MKTIILDAGHGGNDLGDAYGNRYEKNDNLSLTLAVGEVLESFGYDVVYTRVTDVYLSQYDRVQIANRSEGELLLAIHRIIGELAISDEGLGFYMYSYGGIAEETAINIAEELRPIGFEYFSMDVRTDYPILSNTNMPAIVMGIGYLNSDYDNMLFDTRLHEMAYAIARGIRDSIPLDNDEHYNKANQTNQNDIKLYEEEEFVSKYAVQVGLFINKNNADNVNNELLQMGFPSQIVYNDPYYAVQVGPYNDLDYVAGLELCLRMRGYNTLVVLM